ncbi:hypothetical protein EDB19DRAFT_1828686 [Suillus lakei]|nr:hypothetical protein EDB19DRAFT_1828686 [Suillus lakei]
MHQEFDLSIVGVLEFFFHGVIDCSFSIAPSKVLRYTVGCVDQAETVFGAEMCLVKDNSKKGADGKDKENLEKIVHRLNKVYTNGTLMDEDLLTGFVNVFGFPYLIFWIIFLSIVWLMTQLSGQIILGLSSIAPLSYLMIIDSVRDVHSLNTAFTTPPSPPNITTINLTNNKINRKLLFSEIMPLVLLATHTYYSTGHQLTSSSVQWKSASVFDVYMAYLYGLLYFFLTTIPSELSRKARPVISVSLSFIKPSLAVHITIQATKRKSSI